MQQYSHAKGGRPDKLAAEVNRMMADGWVPVGGPVEDVAGAQFIQAMVREQPNGNGVPLREPKKR